MYEKPELTQVGEAEEVILGVIFDGSDMDLNWTIARSDFEKDTISDE